MEYINEQLRGLAMPVESLDFDPRNARLHGKRNMDTVKSSLTRFGQRLPIVVQKQGMIVRVGNARLRAARELGWSHIAAVVVDEGDVEATAFALVDNRSSELGEWDMQVLAEELQNLDGVYGDLEDLGWSADALEVLLECSWSPPDLDEDILPPGLQDGVGNLGGHGNAGAGLVLTDDQEELLVRVVGIMQSVAGQEGFTPGQCVGRLCEAFMASQRASK